MTPLEGAESPQAAGIKRSPSPSAPSSLRQRTRGAAPLSAALSVGPDGLVVLATRSGALSKGDVVALVADAPPWKRTWRCPELGIVTNIDNEKNITISWRDVVDMSPSQRGELVITRFEMNAKNLEPLLRIGSVHAVDRSLAFDERPALRTPGVQASLARARVEAEAAAAAAARATNTAAAAAAVAAEEMEAAEAVREAATREALGERA